MAKGFKGKFKKRLKIHNNDRTDDSHPRKGFTTKKK